MNSTSYSVNLYKLFIVSVLGKRLPGKMRFCSTFGLRILVRQLFRESGDRLFTCRCR
jgi:hypothetical protein